jgi:hypothetical protein
MKEKYIFDWNLRPNWCDMRVRNILLILNKAVELLVEESFYFAKEIYKYINNCKYLQYETATTPYKAKMEREIM